MSKRSYLSRYATLALITLLVARVYCASALPRQDAREAPSRDPFLRFGQALALADFDGDDRLDKATLGGAGRNKRIEIRFSQAEALTFLHFDTLTSERGSLFAKDVDNDGDNDLIWSDLFHPEAVAIWLDDGSGRFERVSPDRYAEAFVLSDAPTVGYPEIPHQDFAFTPRPDRSPGLAPARATVRFTRTPVFSREWQRVPVNARILGTPFDRGPPALLG